MTIYVDVLFAVNMFINYFLLLITSGLAKTVCNRFRITIASVLGGLYCVLAYISELPFLQNAFFKLLLTAIMAVISFKFITFKHFIRCTVILTATAFFFGGLLYGIYFLTKPDFMIINSSAVYFHISPILLVVFGILSYLCITVFTYLLKPQTISASSTYTIHITYHTKSVSTVGFVDTGNMLTDVFTDTPVILCSFDTVENLLNYDEYLFFKNGISEKDISLLPKAVRLIPVSTVGGSTLLPSFKPDNLLLETNEKKYNIEKVLIAVFDKKEYNSQHPAILNPELIISKNEGDAVNVFKNM